MMKKSTGFTLIELMIVVVIVAILAAVAYPSYQNFVRRSARADAKSALLTNAQFMERNFTSANRYDADSAGNPIEDASLPAMQSPSTGPAKYTMSVEVDDATPLQYVLRAEPVAGTLMANDACGTFVINQAGLKSVENATMTAAQCWNQ
jgi:type IV pilus assembly protein PilE